MNIKKKDLKVNFWAAFQGFTCCRYESQFVVSLSGIRSILLLMLGLRLEDKSEVGHVRLWRLAIFVHFWLQIIATQQLWFRHSSTWPPLPLSLVVRFALSVSLVWICRMLTPSAFSRPFTCKQEEPLLSKRPLKSLPRSLRPAVHKKQSDLSEG